MMVSSSIDSSNYSNSFFSVGSTESSIDTRSYSDASFPVSSTEFSRAGTGSIALSPDVETYIQRDPFTYPVYFKSLCERFVCLIETTTWHILDGFNWGAYLGVWAMASATFMVGMMALPIIIKSAVTGVLIMACESIGEAVLRYAATDEFPHDRLPVLLDRVPIDELPIIGDFLSFRWLRNLPFQGAQVNENKLTYFGSRMLVGSVYGAFIGFFTAITSLAPLSILATGAVVAMGAFALRVLCCVKVVPDFLFLSNHENMENCLYQKDLFMHRSIKDRLVGNMDSSKYIPIPPPKDIESSLRLLGIATQREDVTEDLVFQAAKARCVEIARHGNGTDMAFCNRLLILLRHAQEQLYLFIKQRDLRALGERRHQERAREQERVQDFRDRELFGFTPDQPLDDALIDAGYQSVAAQYDRLRNIDRNTIDQSARRLRRR